MSDAAPLDTLFHDAVADIDAGDVAALERRLAAHPRLVHERLEAPGAWLRDAIGAALDGFFARPYLLWFVAEDAVRVGTLPANIAEVTRAIVRALDRERPASRQEQLDYALRLVAWSWVAARCGVQRALVDVLVDAGATLDGRPEDALVNGHAEAAAHLVARGAAPTLASALCLGRWEDVARLAPVADPAQRRFALVLAALNGRAEGVRRALQAGADPNAPSEHLYAHGTPLHHAVCSGSLETVQALVDAGAHLDARDTLWGGTAVGWAEHYVEESRDGERHLRYSAILAWLRGRAPATRVDGSADASA